LSTRCLGSPTRGDLVPRCAKTSPETAQDRRVVIRDVEQMAAALVFGVLVVLWIALGAIVLSGWVR
jgi:hypothetical protein